MLGSSGKMYVSITKLRHYLISNWHGGQRWQCSYLLELTYFLLKERCMFRAVKRCVLYEEQPSKLGSIKTILKGQIMETLSKN